MDEMIGILKEIKPDVDFEKETKLVDNNLIDSFDIVQIVMKLNETFEVEIGADSITPENFNSAASLWALVQKLK